MNGDQCRMIAEIREAIQDGTLDHQEIERRLSIAIEAELYKKDGPANMQLIKACQDFLWELNTDGMPYISCVDTVRIAVEEKLKKREKRRTYGRSFFRIAFATMTLILLFVIGDGLINRGWLKSHSTKDEQQYVIKGELVNPGLVTKGTADADDEPSDLTTESLHEALTFLGFQPEMPTWLPEGWMAKTYYVSIGVASNRINISFLPPKKDAATLFYSARIFENTENAFVSFEQNADGERTNINDNIVYVAQNEDRTTCIWIKSFTVYTLSSTLDIADIQKIITSMGGESRP